jgi:hypothetical protein
MPSTYTSNLGIEKPGDGEQDGVWGDTVNENSDILDRAVNGVLSLILSGTSSTLTTSDGVLSNGQYKLLVLTGTPSGTHTITISPNTAQKIYYVRNTTAQSVIFTQGSGGNYTLLAGDSAIIYANGVGAGSAVVNIADYLAMSSPNITGGAISGAAITSSTATLSSLVATTADINGGTIDGATVGATAASTGKFTAVASDTLTNTAGTRGPTLTKGYVETVFALSGTTPALDPANGTVQTWTLTGNSTPTDSFAAGESMTLMIDDGTVFAVTWPSVVWKSDGGFAPLLNLTGFTAVVLWKVGAVLYGARVGDA